MFYFFNWAGVGLGSDAQPKAFLYSWHWLDARYYHDWFSIIFTIELVQARDLTHTQRLCFVHGHYWMVSTWTIWFGILSSFTIELVQVWDLMHAPGLCPDDCTLEHTYCTVKTVLHQFSSAHRRRPSSKSRVYTSLVVDLHPRLFVPCFTHLLDGVSLPCSLQVRVGMKSDQSFCIPAWIECFWDSLIL